MEPQVQWIHSGVALLQPMMALVIWSMVVWAWMYATRLPAISAMKMKLDPTVPSGTQMAQLPAKVRWKADNYNHLMEQPTLFYAVTLALCFLNQASELAVVAAWSYVVLRIIHSLFQALFNIIQVRFVLFILSNIPLMIMIYLTASRVF
ncbi:MAPEG family protein [Thalassolituus maritimus]